MKAIYSVIMVVIAAVFAGAASADDTWNRYSSENGLPADEVRAIAEDGAGILWFGTDGGGVAAYDGESYTVYTTDDGLPANEVRAIAEDTNGVLWLGTPRGVATFDGKTVTAVEQKDLVDANIASITVDVDNTVWIATYGKGLFAYDGKDWSTYTEKDGLISDFVQSVYPVGDGSYWIGGFGGVMMLDDGVITNLTAGSGLEGKAVFAITEDKDGNLWFGTNTGPYAYDGVSWKKHEAYAQYDILHERSVYTISVDGDGAVWMGTTTGVWKYDGEYWTSYTGRTTDFKVTTYNRAILTDSTGKNWIGNRDGALSTAATGSGGAAKPAQPAPEQVILTGNYPNPFNPSTTITFTLPATGHTTLDVYSMTGQKIRTLVADTLPAGNHEILWDGADENSLAVSSGVYFARLRYGDVRLNHKMTFVK